MNSTTVLHTLEEIAEDTDSREINIQALAHKLDITVPKAISLLTELEHRDEVTIEITTDTNAVTNEPIYSGFVRLMRMPPDEQNDASEIS